MGSGVEAELIRTALPFWEAEAQITRRFFSGKPSREDHIFWLKAQLWKELHPVERLLHRDPERAQPTGRAVSKIDKDIDRHRYHHLLEQMTQEFNHYVLMADALEYLFGHPISAKTPSNCRKKKRLRNCGENMQTQVLRWTKRRCW